MVWMFAISIVNFITSIVREIQGSDEVNFYLIIGTIWLVGFCLSVPILDIKKSINKSKED